MAKALNAEGIAAPRPRKHRIAAGWCPTGIREMLYNEIYIGRRVWNRSKFVKVPGTNRRVARPRPPQEWKVSQDDSLHIIPQDLWNRVQARLKFQKETYGQGRPAGLLSRSATSPYLFSGLLVCSECGAKLTIVTGSSRKGRAFYGCSRNYSRGTCSNDLHERRDVIETRLLASLQQAVLRPEAVDYALCRFQQALSKEIEKVSYQADELRTRKGILETEIANLTRALADGYSSALTTELAKREVELTELNTRLVSGGPGSVQASMEELRHFVTSRLADVQKLLSADIAKARAEIARHVDKIVLRPTQDINGKRFYAASGEWSLIGKDLGPQDDAAPVKVRMVAGDRFERSTFGL